MHTTFDGYPTSSKKANADVQNARSKRSCPWPIVHVAPLFQAGHKSAYRTAKPVDDPVSCSNNASFLIDLVHGQFSSRQGHQTTALLAIIMGEVEET